MVLRNFVELTEGEPTVMHFIRGQVVEKEITDPLTNLPKTVRVLELTVDRLNGQATSATYSVTSEKLAQTLFPFIERGQISDHTFVITQRGSGFRREYEVQTLPA